jgi:AcrR family transcriptional regulator
VASAAQGRKGRQPDHADSRGDRTRRAILSAIRKLLTRQEVADITLADICKATKLTTGAVYFHFAGKDEAVEEMVIEEVAAIYSRHLAGPALPTFPAFIRRLIADSAAYEQANGRLSRAIQQVINARPRAYGAWIAARTPVIDALAALIRDARTAQGLSPDPAGFLALFILNSIEDLGMDVYQWKNPTLQPFAPSADAWAERQGALWEWAILAPMPAPEG